MATAVGHILSSIFYNKFDYAPCSCWNNPINIGFYDISTETNNRYSNGSQEVKIMTIYCTGCRKSFRWNCEDRGITDQDVENLE